MRSGRRRNVVWSGVGVFVVLACLASVSDASRQTASLYNEGNALYRDGSYREAIERYQAALATGLQNSDVYYNLANALYKAGDVGPAILNYERALRLSPHDPDIIGNLAFVNARKADRFEEESPNAVTRFVGSVYAALSPNLLTVSVTIALLGTCVGACGLMFSVSRRVLWIGVVALSLAAGTASVGLLTLKARDLTAREAIVLAAETHGRSGPGDDFLQVFTLHEGTRVVVEREEGAWGLVRLPNGVGGWILLRSIGTI